MPRTQALLGRGGRSTVKAVIQAECDRPDPPPPDPDPSGCQPGCIAIALLVVGIVLLTFWLMEWPT